MPRHVTNARHEWFLPLVGGAEMNRLAPPPKMYLTSRLYPVMAGENMGVGAEVHDAKTILKYSDNIYPSGGVVAGALTYVGVGYKSFKAPIEGVHTVGGVSAANLVFVGVTYRAISTSDSLSTGGAILSASITRQVIHYNNYLPEGLLTGASVPAISLTHI